MNPFRAAMLFDLCHAAGLNSADIARALDVSRTTVTYWKQGVNGVSPAHHEALMRLALSMGTQWRILHRQRTGQLPPEEYTPGTTVVSVTSPPDYVQWMLDAFDAALAQLRQQLVRPREQFDMAAVRAMTAELDGMARALETILTPNTDAALQARIDRLQEQMNGVTA